MHILVILKQGILHVIYKLSIQQSTSYVGRPETHHYLLSLFLFIHSSKFGSFNYAPFRTPYDPKNPYLPNKVKTPDRATSPASSSSANSPSPNKAKRQILPKQSPTQSARMRTKDEDEEGFDQFDEEQGVSEGVEEQMHFVDSPDDKPSTGAKDSTEKAQQRKSPTTKPPTTTKPAKFSIVNKLAEKFSAMEDDSAESEESKLESPTKPVKQNTEEQDTKPSESSVDKTDADNESKEESDQKESVKESEKKESESDDKKVDEDSEIMKEIMAKAQEHEGKDKEESSAAKVEVTKKVNPFLKNLVESCKEKLGISEVSSMCIWYENIVILREMNKYWCDHS